MNVFCWSEHIPLVTIYGRTWKTNSKMLLCFHTWAESWQLISLIMQRWNYSKNYRQASRFEFSVKTGELFPLCSVTNDLPQCLAMQTSMEQTELIGLLVLGKIDCKVWISTGNVLFSVKSGNILWVVIVPWANFWNYYQV